MRRTVQGQAIGTSLLRLVPWVSHRLSRQGLAIASGSPCLGQGAGKVASAMGALDARVAQRRPLRAGFRFSEWEAARGRGGRELAGGPAAPAADASRLRQERHAGGGAAVLAVST